MSRTRYATDAAVAAATASLTDNSGGTAADTIAVIGGTYAQAEVANAVASLAAKVNDIKTELGAVRTKLGF